MSTDVEAAIAYVPVMYGAVAALTMITYDYAITFDDEFEFVWKRPWSLGKILFLFNRYFGLLTFLSIWMAFSFGPSSPIYAVYNCSRRLLLIMIAFLVAAIASSSWLAISTLPTIAPMMVSNTPGCTLNGATPPHALFFWIPFLIFETFLVALMLCKGWRVYRSEGGSRLLHLIIRDRYAYMASGPIFMALLANCIVWATPSLDPRTVACFAIALPCAMGCRLLLNMRESFYKETTTIWTVMSV
ncbi:hypothetical protein JB92DRAFT_3004519 [Gautieria morchelliformis]|nr:hypothetical protein JB92DRAFT_3004519 [Gautieria morchelliformis]